MCWLLLFVYDRLAVLLQHHHAPGIGRFCQKWSADTFSNGNLDDVVFAKSGRLVHLVRFDDWNKGVDASGAVRDY